MHTEPTESPGIITHRSPWGLDETLQRLQRALATKGLKVFAEIDQRAEARAVGLNQPPMQLILVGNPRAGTPIMTAAPLAGLDLPLKLLVWEASAGTVNVSLNSANYIAARHGLAPELAQGLQGLELLVQKTLIE
jgi:uncharacterized protein (DUF302 family)